MKRREFIGMAAAGAAGFALPGSAPAEHSVPSSLAQPRLLKILRDEEVVRELGQAYLARTPGENDARTLAAAIITEAGTVAQIDERVRRDFREGRTVTLNGWILSGTEARQCALFALLPA